MSDTSAPLVPAHVDLRDFGYMPLDVLRLRDSDLSTIATGDEFKSAVLLWCVAWHQVPAGSIPNDDRWLARHSGAGAAWNRVKEEALRGFVPCSDGRLYHRVICEKALESWGKKEAQRRQTRNATEARLRRNAPRNESRHEPITEHNEERIEERDDNRNVDQGKGREGIVKGEGSKPTSIPDPTARGTRLPKDFEPPQEWLSWAIREESTWDFPYAQKMFQEFRDYWAALPGKDALKLDWLATWRNRVRYLGPKRNGIGKTASNPPNKQEALEERNRAVAESWTPPEDPHP